jgi:catechol 2,3-dioxygenase-like lactoylglutathione lyase family enzyme
VRPQTLDHVAYWLADRDAVADFAVRHLGMHVIADEANSRPATTRKRIRCGRSVHVSI